jgi:hypothetical protein
MHNHGSRGLLPTLIWLLLPACSFGTDTKPADNRGRLVATFADVSDLTWSTDGSDLYFIEGMFRIRAVSASGDNLRTLYSSNISVGDIRAVANKLYLSVARIATPAEYYVVRIDPENPTDVDTVVTYSGQVQSHQFAVSADERFVAFGDSLFDVQAASQRALPKGDPWSFSPDGSQLLMDLDQQFGTFAFALVATSDGTSQPLSTATDVARPHLFAIGAHYWEGNDPKVLRIVISAERDHIQLSVRDVRTGANKAIESITNPPGGLYTAGAIADDGSRAVIMIGALFLWNELHAIDVQSGERTIVARVNGSPAMDQLAISSDASRIAYVVFESTSIKSSGDATVYVVD